jgi:hypothetical protein
VTTLSPVFLLFQAEIVGAVDDKGIDLAEGAFVEQQVDALAGGQASFLVLGFDAFFPAPQAADRDVPRSGR